MLVRHPIGTAFLSRECERGKQPPGGCGLTLPPPPSRTMSCELAVADRPEMSDVQPATPMAHFETVRVARGVNAAWQPASARVVFRGVCGGGGALLLTAESPAGHRSGIYQLDCRKLKKGDVGTCIKGRRSFRCFSRSC